LAQTVDILYRENDWVYVIASESRAEGFIPHSYCTPFHSQLGELALSNVKKKLPRGGDLLAGAARAATGGCWSLEPFAK
jgi:hypothetical protein